MLDTDGYDWLPRGGALTRRATIAFCLGALLTAAAVLPVHAADRCGDIARAERQQCRMNARETFMAMTDACRGRLPSCVQTCRIENRHCIDQALVKTCAHRARALVGCLLALRQCAGGCVLGAPPGGTRQCIVAATAGFRSDLATCVQDARNTKLECRAKIRSCVEDCGAAADSCDEGVRAARRDAIVLCNRTQVAALAACHVAFPGGGIGLDRCVTKAKGDGAACRDDARLTARQGFLDCRLALGTCVKGCPNQ